jgi:uracil-DNA glycosylase
VVRPNPLLQPNLKNMDKIEWWHHVIRTGNEFDLSDQYVPGEGAQRDCEVLIIGEAPGAQEEIRHRPFVGPAGRVLRQLMANALLYTDDWENEEQKCYGVANTWLTNVVKFRPPRNRKPTPEEITAFRWLLRTEWMVVGKPRVIVPVGSTALHAIFGKPMSILKVAGRPHKVHSRLSDMDLHIWPMVHPAFGLRNKAVQPLLEKDWNKLAEWRKTQ